MVKIQKILVFFVFFVCIIRKRCIMYLYHCIMRPIVLYHKNVSVLSIFKCMYFPDPWCAPRPFNLHRAIQPAPRPSILRCGHPRCAAAIQYAPRQRTVCTAANSKLRRSYPRVNRCGGGPPRSGGPEDIYQIKGTSYSFYMVLDINLTSRYTMVHVRCHRVPIHMFFAVLRS